VSTIRTVAARWEGRVCFHQVCAALVTRQDMAVRSSQSNQRREPRRYLYTVRSNMGSVP
jgi:hypothetical protein